MKQGSLLIRIAKGFANDMNYSGIACRFLTVDADVINNPTIDKFYLKNGFKYNEEYRSRTKAISMRLDLFH